MSRNFDKKYIKAKKYQKEAKKYKKEAMNDKIMIDIADSIILLKRKNYFTDEEINRILEYHFYQYLFEFCSCAEIDRIIRNDRKPTGYWREAYHFPKDGEYIPDIYAIAEDCGQFTFNLRNLTAEEEKEIEILKHSAAC